MSDASVSTTQSQAQEPRLFNNTYSWMFLAVAITAVISLAMVTLPLVSSIVLKTVAPDIGAFVWLIFLEFLLVGYLTPALPRRPTFSIGSAFLGLAVLNGLIVSFVLTYAGRSVGETYLFALYDGLAGRGWLWQHIGATLEAVLYGLIFAVVLGVPLGIALGSSRDWYRIWQPAIQTMYAVPKTMLYPVFIVLFGVSIGSRIAIAFSHAVFPIMIGAMTGAVARASSRVPALATAVRSGLSLSVIGVVLSEMYASNEGLGFVLMVSLRGSGGANLVLAIILLLFLVLLLVNAGLWALKKRWGTKTEAEAS